LSHEWERGRKIQFAQAINRNSNAWGNSGDQQQPLDGVKEGGESAFIILFKEGAVPVRAR